MPVFCRHGGATIMQQKKNEIVWWPEVRHNSAEYLNKLDKNGRNTEVSLDHWRRQSSKISAIVSRRDVSALYYYVIVLLVATGYNWQKNQARKRSSDWPSKISSKTSFTNGAELIGSRHFYSIQAYLKCEMNMASCFLRAASTVWLAVGGLPLHCCMSIMVLKDSVYYVPIPRLGSYWTEFCYCGITVSAALLTHNFY